MSKANRIALCAAVAFATLAAASASASAKSSGGGSKGSFSSSKSFSSKVVFSKPGIKHKHRYYAYGAPLVYASYSSCGWLKARALETGSPRWWARYEACRDGE